MHRHVVAAQGGDTRRFHPRRACADDQHPALELGGRDLMRLFDLAPGRGVVDAISVAALVDPVEAVVRTDAGADVVLALFDDLAHDMRVGHMGAGHAHHVKLAAGDGVAGGGDIRDAAGVKGRQADLGPDAPRKIQMRRRGHALDRDDIGHGRVGVDLTANDI